MNAPNLLGLWTIQDMTPVTWDTTHPTGMEGIPQPIAPIRPSENVGAVNPNPLPGTPDFMNQVNSNPTPGSSNFWQELWAKLGEGMSAGAAGGAGIPIQQQDPSQTAKMLGMDNTTIGRAVSIILGLIFVGAGIMMFKQTQVVIDTARKGVTKAAEIAAL